MGPNNVFSASPVTGGQSSKLGVVQTQQLEFCVESCQCLALVAPIALIFYVFAPVEAGMLTLLIFQNLES